MKFDIFNKKRYLELYKRHEAAIEANEIIIRNLENRYTEIMQRDRDWNKELLFQNSELNQEIKKLKERTKKAEEISECFRLDNEIYKEDFTKIAKENAILKEAKQYLRASLGGTKKQNNKLNQELGIMKLKLEIMEKTLKEYKLPPPTMKEIYEYERTGKSPRKNKNSILL